MKLTYKAAVALVLTKTAIAFAIVIPTFSANACDITTDTGTCAYWTSGKKPVGKTIWEIDRWPMTEIVEESTPFRCQEGSHCGSVTLNMGNNKCKSTDVNVGFSYTLPLKEVFGSLEFTGGGAKSWSVCSSKSISVTCPNITPGTQVTAQIGQVKKYGMKEFTGYVRVYRPGQPGNCDLGGTYKNNYGQQNTCVLRGNVTVKKYGWWPSSDFAQCSAPTPF